MTAEARRGAFDPDQALEDDFLDPPPFLNDAATTSVLAGVTASTGTESRASAARQMATEHSLSPRLPTTQLPSSTRFSPAAEVAARRTAGAALANEMREGSTQTRKAVAVRIPRVLYDAVVTTLLSDSERASYGQLVAWTVEDHAEAVLEELLARQRARTSRSPRGRRLPADTVPITLRLLPEELDSVDLLVDAAGGTEAGVTRTALAVAALHVAVQTALGIER